MQELEELKRLLIFDPVLALDLETKAPEGRPADEALETDKAQLYLVALAAGRGASLKSYALPPTAEVLEFVQDYLKKKYVRVVGHNLINYDIEVLHYNKVIRFEEIQARLVDTLPLVWMIDEAKTTDRGLKASARKFLGVNMTTFEEAFISSPNALEIRRLTHIKKSVAKTTETRLKILRQTRIAEKKRLTEELKKKYEDKRDKESRAKKKRSSANIDRYIDTTFGEVVQTGIRISAEEEVKKIDEKIVELDKAWIADKVRYAADDSRRSLQLYGRVRNILEKRNLLRWADMEIKNKIACTAMQLAGMRVDADRLESLDKELIPLVKELESRLYDMAKCDFNPRSSKQMNTLIFETLGVPPVRETTRQRNPQTGEMEVVIKEVKNTNEKTLARIDHPFVQALLNYRAISKLHSTYVVSLRQRALLDPEWRIHCIFNSTGTVTGRYASHDPNLQNIPSRAKPSEYDERVQDLGPRIRWAFCAPKGKKLVCADLSQIELRLIAQVTGDNHLLEIYNEHTVYDGLKFYTGDIHKATSEALGIPRKPAKNCNFGLSYGMGAAKFARYARLFIPGTREWDVATARTFKDKFMDRYQGIPETIGTLQDMIDGRDQRFKTRNFKMLTGRYRHFSKNENLYGGKAFNSIIQGSAADLIKIIVWNIYKTIVLDPTFEGTRLVLQVHDEVGLEVPEELAQAVGVMVKYIMERPWFNLDVPVLASVKVCDDWSQKDDDAVPEIGTMPPEEAKIKPAVAMLTPDEEAWAAQFLPEVECYSV
jgi:DNA polymerase I-like protein with 3'-5' exonuclease and polymerase domains